MIVRSTSIKTGRMKNGGDTLRRLESCPGGGALPRDPETPPSPSQYREAERGHEYP